MYIKGFTWFIENAKDMLKTKKMNDKAVVIDAQNYFCNKYQESKLKYRFGSESDKYADFLRRHLQMYKDANIHCYFIFKGGHEDISKLFKRKEGGQQNEKKNRFVPPIFMKDVYKEVLDEMKFDYFICETEAKQECIAFAKANNCPIMSNDIEFIFSGIEYIPFKLNDYDRRKKVLTCRYLNLDTFLEKYELDEEKLAIFIVLTDQNQFEFNYFEPLFQSLDITNEMNFLKKYASIILWLSETSKLEILFKISEFVKSEDQDKFQEALLNMKLFIRRPEAPGLASEYFRNGNKLTIFNNDPQWFAKGIAGKHVHINLINLYRSKYQGGSWVIADENQNDALLFSIDIIKYCYNLLNNFNDDEITFMESKISVSDSIPKPKYQAICSPFENGWDDIKDLQLFEHFIKESLMSFDFEIINQLPEDVKLLMISLVYFYKKHPLEVQKYVCGVLVSYVALNNIFPNKTNQYIQNNEINKAIRILNELSTNYNLKVDEPLIHPCVEFQHCLQNINYLNKLCGAPFQPTIYSKTFNGTLVYQVIHTITNVYDGNVETFLNIKFREVPQILFFLNKLLNIVKNAQISNNNNFLDPFI